MFVMSLQGGLGNQMFQIFAALAYSIKHSKQLVITANLNKWDKRSTYWNSIFRDISNITVHDVNELKQINELRFNYSEIPIINQSFILCGYFQSYKYFETNYKCIYNKLGLRKIIDYVRPYLNNSKNTISIHFRMGDYKTCLPYHAILLDNYYASAIKYITNSTGTSNWSIFYACEQDDNAEVLNRIENIKNELNNQGIQFIKIEDSLMDWEQMLLMSACDHNIIANSTFSWWSAYINDNKNKIVCYPDTWFGHKNSHLDTSDMFPSDWIKIKS